MWCLEIYNGFEYLADEDRTKLETIICKFDRHFKGQSNETYEHYLFNQRQQNAGESFETYYAAQKIPRDDVQL